jgi:hypothetical protein
MLYFLYEKGYLMKKDEIDLDANAEIVKECVDKLNDVVSDFYFGENEEKFKNSDLGSLMSASIFTFFMLGIKKMNAGVKRSFPAASYLEFIKEKVNIHIDNYIKEQKNAKEN